MIIEVFKTNVENADLATMLARQIRSSFSDYTANFDLDDCDRILRVVSPDDHIQTARLMHLLKDFGVRAEVLPDVIPEVFQF